MSGDEIGKQGDDPVDKSEGFVSYLVTLLQMSLVGVLVLTGVGWGAYTVDLWLGTDYPVTRSFEYLPYLIGLAVIVYLLGYLNDRWTSA
ncbi:hypothetical protein [Natrinema salsiterrestre]|uniref:Uncharacterized protein n=1 Tax=Natrinema salsiterrestre TaxID=2950540 RepID=A0A9Q4KZ78_9EURY|nr:hypothetical protein [Natrinema salsiterrestre]MDF9744472.1 hypothetical protein [Natrinema salsiterrestre]